jgi:uncharacterized protein (TIGR03032 family)
LLSDLNCSIGITTYQAGKLVFLSPKGRESLVQLPRTFDKPMGLAIDADAEKIALACKGEVVVFRNSTGLAQYYPQSPNTYDALYMPRVIYKTSYLDIHDLEFGNDGMYAVNTLFSCISKIEEDYNFVPYWQPKFVTELVSEDRCHLNGMVMQNGKPRYVSCFNEGNTFQSWKKTLPDGGVLIDIESNEVIARDLSMPHSPRLINGALYVLLSGTGDLVKVDIESGKKEVVLNLGGFVRGMHYHEGFLFIGLSKIRRNSSSFGKLPISDKATYAGVAIVHLETASLWGEIKYQTSVDEIYDVKIFKDKTRPSILNPYAKNVNLGIATPEKTFWAKTNESNNDLL